jgi:hypothetical protein
MATIPGAILLGMSSPYAKRGVLWENFRDHYGKDDSPVLVWRARTRAMNPTVSRAVIAAAYLRDAASAKAEYGAQFRSEIESFIPIEALEACVVPGRFELGPIPGVNYFGFTDPSGGSSDSFTLGIAHADGETVALDLLRETQPPFSPEAVIADFGTTLKKYRLSEVTGDRYAGEFPRELFSKCGVTYRVAEKTRSELYLELLPCLMSGRVQLLDNKRLVAQLSGLERRTARSGKDSIDHGPGQHDDCSNAVAGAAVLAMAAHGGVLGVLEYEQLEAAGKLGTLQTQASNKEFLYQFEAKVRGLQPTAPALQWKEEPLPACPACKTTIVAQLSAKEFRCAECATQWFKVSHEPNPVRGQRGEWLAGGPNAKSFRIRKQEFFWMDLTK